jgi:hypothetical protein
MQSRTEQEYMKLRDMVLAKAGFTTFKAEDVPQLITLIEQKTGNRLTLNTTSRTFGFMESKFGPSQFTLDTMSVFCGYTGWNDAQAALSA